MRLNGRIRVGQCLMVDLRLDLIQHFDLSLLELSTAFELREHLSHLLDTCDTSGVHHWLSNDTRNIVVLLWLLDYLCQVLFLSM